MNPGGGSGWDEPPLDIQIPDDARELDRDVLAYHRELRAQRRRNRLRRLAGPFAPFAAHGSVMPLLASILAVCLVAGAMLSVATFSPATTPADRTAQPRPPRSPASSLGPKSTPAAPVRPFVTSASAARASHSASPSASSSKHQAGRRHPGPGLTRCPALSPAGGTATIAFRPTGVNRGGGYRDALEPPHAVRRAGRAGAGAGRLRGRLQRAHTRVPPGRLRRLRDPRTASRSPTRSCSALPQRPGGGRRPGRRLPRDHLAGRGQAGLGQRAGHRVRRADPRRAGQPAGRRCRST